MAGFTDRQNYQNVSYKVYIPENCNANTEVLVYCHGGEDKDVGYATNYLKQFGSDTVIIFPTADQGFRETNEYGAQVVNIVDSVKQNLNITNDNLSVAGFSMGSTPTYTIMGEYLKQNPNCGSQTMFLLDNYPNARYSSTVKFDSLLNDYGSYYKNNNTMFVAMIPQWGESRTFIIGSKQTELDYLAKHGITNVSVLHSYKATFPGYYSNLNLYGESHNIVEQGFWIDGFFNMSNNSTVTYGANEYKLTIFNKVTGQYEVTDFANLNSLDKLRQYFGINIAGNVNSTIFSDVNNESEVFSLTSGEDFLKAELTKLSELKLFDVKNKLVKSDKDRLLGNVNDVLNNIKDTSFVSNGLNLSFSGSSSTKVPSGIPNIIGLYFTFATDLLTELSLFMNKVGEAGESIEELDKLFKEEASNLNDEATLNTNVSTTLPLTGNNDNNSNTILDNNLNNSVNSDINSNMNNNFNVNLSNNNVIGNLQNGVNNVTDINKPNYSSGSYYSNHGGTTGHVSNVNNVTDINKPNYSSGSYYSNHGGTTGHVSNVNNSSNIGHSNNISSNGITTVVPSNNEEVILDNQVNTTVNTDIYDEVTTVVDNVTNTVDNNLPVIDSTKPIGDINLPVDNPIIDSPNIEDVFIKNESIINIPIDKTSSEVIDNGKTSFSNIGLGIGALGTAVAAGALISKKIIDNKKNEENEFTSTIDNDLKQYKDDYFEEV